MPPQSILHTRLTGSEMIVSTTAPARSDANPAATVGLVRRAGRQAHVAVWTGFDMIVWSGGSRRTFTNQRALRIGTFTASSLTTREDPLRPAGPVTVTAGDGPPHDRPGGTW
jgi:hypothetical protein